MEAAIYPSFEVVTPFDFDLRYDERLFPSSGPTPALDLDSILNPPARKSNKFTLPSTAHTRQFTYTFGIQNIFPLLIERLTSFLPRDGKTTLKGLSSTSIDATSFHFAPRRVSCRYLDLESPVPELLGTNTVVSANNAFLIARLVSDLTHRHEVLESDLYILRIAHHELLRKSRSLSSHIDVHGALLMEPSQRIDFLTRIYSVPEIGEQDIELTYIAFDFDEWDTQTGQTSETKIEVLVDFSAAEFNTPSSPVTHDINDIVGDRQILSVDEAQDVLAVLKDTQERLSLIDHNIHVLKRIIQVLESHQGAIAKHIALHRAFLAPVNKLPPELLAEILEHAICSDGSTVKLGPSGLPVVLGNVCSQWRAVSLSTPSLWTSIQMSGNDSTLDGLDCLSTWLKRTGRRRLLSLIVDCSNLSRLRIISAPWTDPFTVLLSILLEYAPRWERLEFNHINEYLLNILCAELHDDCLPGLKSLSFSGEETRGIVRISAYRYRFPVQWRLSKLVCLSLVFDLIDLENLQMGFHLSQLTSLTLRTRRQGWIMGQMDFHGVLDLLSCCPRLEECNLQYDWRPTTMTEVTRTRTVLLENLTIFWFASLRDPQYLLRALELPCLREFEFQYLVSTVNNPLLLDRSPLDDLLNRSGLKCKSWSHQPESNMCQLKAIPIEETL